MKRAKVGRHVSCPASWIVPAFEFIDKVGLAILSSIVDLREDSVPTSLRDAHSIMTRKNGVIWQAVVIPPAAVLQEIL
jgi:hypothetical protein